MLHASYNNLSEDLVLCVAIPLIFTIYIYFLWYSLFFPTAFATTTHSTSWHAFAGKLRLHETKWLGSVVPVS